MTDDPDSILLRYLRRIDEKLERLAGDLAGVKVRVAAFKGQMAAILQTRNAQTAAISRLDARFDRVERLLDLHEEGIR